MQQVVHHQEQLGVTLEPEAPCRASPGSRQASAPGSLLRAAAIVDRACTARSDNGTRSIRAANTRRSSAASQTVSGVYTVGASVVQVRTRARTDPIARCASLIAQLHVWCAVVAGSS